MAGETGGWGRLGLRSDFVKPEYFLSFSHEIIFFPVFYLIKYIFFD